MATVLAVWELGGGLGHLYPLKLVASELCRAGHRVILVLRETAQAPSLLCDLPVQYFQAPAKHRVTSTRIDPPTTYAHLLHNIGWGEAEELAGLYHSWQTILDLVKPDVVVADHSPTPLLALRGRGIPVVTIGTGFCSPPASSPLPKVRPWVKGDDASWLEHEQRLCEQVNQLLERNHQPVLGMLSDLFTEVTTEILTTFPELDHFGPRTSGNFWGCYPSGAATVAHWPRAAGPKVYAYLTAIPDRESYLKTLAQLGFPTIAVAGPVSSTLQQQLRGSSIHLATSPINVEQVASESDLVVNYAGHGVSALALLAGKPLLQIPISVEQFLLASRVAKLGAGIFIPSGNQTAFASALHSLVHQPSFREKAESFAQLHADHRPQELARRIAAHLGSLLS